MNPKYKLEYWQAFNQFQQSREKRYAPRIERALSAQKKQFIDQYKRGQIGIIDAAPLYAIIKDLYFDAAINFGHKVLINIKSQKQTKSHEVKRRMPIGFNERMQQLIEQYYGVDFLNMSFDISETTKDILNAVLIKAQRGGLGFDDIVKQLDKTELSKDRSRLIARTETVTAANSGAILSAKESGILVQKVWIATIDSRTRHDHSNVSEDALDIDSPFQVGQYEMMQPGVRKQPNGLPVPAKEVCNCRCVVAFQPVRDRAGRVVSLN